MCYLENSIASWAGANLGVNLLVSIRNEPISETFLTSGEQLLFSQFTHPAKRRTWLVGRAALKQILLRMGLSPDTSQIEFPHSRISLSHSGDHAVAIASPDRSVLGLGVDLETASGINPKSARFFMSATESQALAEQQSKLVEVWTVKEAIFKSDIDNQHRLLSDYQIVDWPDRNCPGQAMRCVHSSPGMTGAGWHDQAAPFTFCLSDTPIGTVAIAMRKRRENHDYEQRPLAS
jgi:phosphopantetheinyl transferase (holo-ACP synthase)